MRDYIVYGLVLAVVIVLWRIVARTPLITSVAEKFQGGAATPTSLAQVTCPSGLTMYMYDGVAFCCKGNINPDANTVQGSCVRPWMVGQSTVDVNFCTLGPSRDGVANCTELAGEINAQMAQNQCPPSMPNWNKGTCSANADGTGLACSMSPDANFFKSPGSCQFLRAQQLQSCPTGTGTTTTVGQGALGGLTLYGCSDNNQTCYGQTEVDLLTQLGYDASSLNVCPI